MNGTINGAINETVQRTQYIPVRLRAQVKLVLLGLMALTLVSLLYLAVSSVIFEIRTRALLASMDLIGKPAPSNESVKDRGQDPSRPDKAGNPSPEDAKKKERLAQLEQRALFGEPKPTVPQPRVEAIIGDSALINGQWLARGGKTGDYTVVDMETDKVTMTDREGRRHDFALVAGDGSGGGPTGLPPVMKGMMKGGEGDSVGGESDSFIAETAKKTATETAGPFDAPQAVLRAIKQYSPGAMVKKIQWDSRRGHYAVETSTSDGRDIDMKIAGDGTLRVKDEEVHLADLPQGVHAVVQGKLAGGGALSDLKRWTRDGRISYEAEIKTGSQKTTLELAEDGTALNKN